MRRRGSRNYDRNFSCALGALTLKIRFIASCIASILVYALLGVAAPAEQLTRMEWKIDGVVREALVYAPASARNSPTPVIFAFHGHGGSMRNAERKFGFQRLWPEAISVYMQGLPTPGMTDPEGKRPGWQKSPGDQADRDLKFFDAVLATIKKDFKVDESRIYAMGHSNGGGFTYLLWGTRGDVFAAVAPAAAGAARVLKDLKPKPAMHVAGRGDQVVPFENQERTMEAIRKLNGCDAAGQSWAPFCTLYPSPSGNPVVTFIYQGGHPLPDEAPAAIARFFKEHRKK